MYRIRDASEKLMTVVGTVQLEVIPQGSCVKYTLRAIVTSSMSCIRGLLGFPDLVSLGLISGEWVTKDHICKARVMVGALGLPKQCENSVKRGEKRASDGVHNKVAKRIKLYGDHRQQPVATANVNRHNAGINVMFHGEMKDFFNREVLRLRE